MVMDIIIQEVVSTVRAVDGTALLEPRTMAQIVRAVMAAMAAHSEQEKRREADTSTNTPTGEQEA
jgi:hypothetical protein